MKTEKFQRKPFIVEVVQVTAENMVDVAKWCKGTVTTTPTEIAEQLKKPVQTWIQVETQQPMNEKQKQAFVGDWILFANRGFKIYTDSAFKRTFEPCFQAPTPQETFFKGGDYKHTVDEAGRMVATVTETAPQIIQVDEAGHESTPAFQAEKIIADLAKVGLKVVPMEVEA